jgi:hypothetical protein
LVPKPGALDLRLRVINLKELKSSRPVGVCDLGWRVAKLITKKLEVWVRRRTIQSLVWNLFDRYREMLKTRIYPKFSIFTQKVRTNLPERQRQVRSRHCYIIIPPGAGAIFGEIMGAIGPIIPGFIIPGPIIPGAGAILGEDGAVGPII